MSLPCFSCGANLKVGNAVPGSKAKCPRCGTTITIPANTGIVAQSRAISPANPASGDHQTSPQPGMYPQGNTSSGSGNRLGLVIGGLAILLLIVLGTGAWAVLNYYGSSNNQIASAKDDQNDPDQLSSKSDGRDQDPNSVKDKDQDQPPEKGNDIGSKHTNKKPPEEDPFNAPTPGKNPVKTGSRITGALYQLEFMGTKGEGNRFCIIADRSGSMKSGYYKINSVTGKKEFKYAIDYLKEELLRTLNDLNQKAHVNVMFYSSDITTMPGKGDWRKGGDEAAELIPWIKGLEANGNTRPGPAFVRAANFKPRPDVIFFMTDGIIPPKTKEFIDSLDWGRNHPKINTIQLHVQEDPAKDLIDAWEAKGKSLNNVTKEFYDKVMAKRRRGLPPTPEELQNEAQLRAIATSYRGTYKKIQVSPF